MFALTVGLKSKFRGLKTRVFPQDWARRWNTYALVNAELDASKRTAFVAAAETSDESGAKQDGKQKGLECENPTDEAEEACAVLGQASTGDGYRVTM